MSLDPVLIVGGGAAGISCARYLHEASRPFMLFESQERLGGRIRSDFVDGYTLDRGFQILLTSYPEVRRLLEYKNFPVRPFFPGAVIWDGESFSTVADPFRQPFAAFRSVFGAVGSLRDKLLVLQLRFEAMRGPLSRLWTLPEYSTREYLQRFGFSERFIRSFFTPFLSGVFLDPTLSTSSRMMLFVVRMFGAGMAVLPCGGMGALPAQLAAPLPESSLRLQATVATYTDRMVALSTGQEFSGSAVVVARPAIAEGGKGSWSGTTTVYFSTSKTPYRGPYLMLNGSGRGQISNVVVLSEVAREYAPTGMSLVSVSIPHFCEATEGELERQVRAELRAWFGPAVDDWRFLKSYRIREALPQQLSVPLSARGYEGAGPFYCGDYLTNGSLHGALASGREAAESIIKLGLAAMAE